MDKHSELNALLEGHPLWEKLKTLPEEVDALKKRIEELESTGKEKAGGKCPKCSRLTYVLDRTVADPTFGALGVHRNHYVCSSCNYTTFEQVG